MYTSCETLKVGYMIHTKYLILGAGPVGSVFVKLFLKAGETDF